MFIKYINWVQLVGIQIYNYWDYFHFVYTQTVPVTFEPHCTYLKEGFIPHRKDSSPQLQIQIHWQSIRQINAVHLMFMWPSIIVIVEEWKTNLTSLAILFHFLCTQHVSDINISIISSLRLCCWITTSVVLFSVRCA